MKRSLFTLAFSFLAFASFSQSNVGLIAHWDMNGTANDVSGNGHNGHMSNVAAAAGINGISNTAYYFDGATSIITAPYLSDLNVTQYSICAIVKPQGFYYGTCQANMIIARGKPTGTPGSYDLYFTDNPYDGNNCSAVDSTKDVFCTAASSFNAPFVDWQYSPQIVKNQWYKVIGSWDGTDYRIYVNGVLQTTVPGTGSTFGTSTDSISIGMDLYEVPTSYPYYFKGLIDDIRLYNRVLNDSEAAHYGDTCGSITLQPTASVVHSGGTATYTVNSTISGVTYQWQQNSGTGFVNLSNAGAYSGVNTNTLTVSGATTAMNNYVYRCLLSNTWGCADTTTSALLTLGVDNVLSNETVLVYPNPVNNIVSIQLPLMNANGSIQLINEVGQVMDEKNISNKTTELDLTGLPSGIYIARILVDQQVIYKKITKN